MVALGAVGCGGDECVSRCSQGKDEGCVTESTDCEMVCDDAAEAETDARADAATAGCTAEFDAIVACSDALAVCDTGCGDETSAYGACFVAFCTDNPDSEACAAP